MPGFNRVGNSFQVILRFGRAAALRYSWIWSSAGILPFGGPDVGGCDGLVFGILAL